MTLEVQPQAAVEVPQDTQATQDTQPVKNLMNLAPLEDFIVDTAMILAGSVVSTDNTESFSPEQLGVIFFSAVGAFARTQADYDPEQDISDIIRLGVATYGESIYATVNAELLNLTQQSDGLDGSVIQDAQ